MGPINSRSGAGTTSTLLCRLCFRRSAIHRNPENQQLFRSLMLLTTMTFFIYFSGFFETATPPFAIRYFTADNKKRSFINPLSAKLTVPVCFFFNLLIVMF